MRAVEREIERESREVFAAKTAAFETLCPDGEVKNCFERRIAETPAPEAVLWRQGDKLDASEVLSGQIRPLPETGLPILIAGGSFNSDRHATRMSPEGKAVIDTLLREADPARCFFVVGHRLTGYEGYLAEQARGRFAVYAFVPSALSPAERDRLRRSGVCVRPSIEPIGNGIYKSFAYEIFKRRSSVLLAFDGNSPAANLVQEARNGRFRCEIYVDGRCRALSQKARMLQGYVSVFGRDENPAETILSRHALRRMK